MVPDASAADRPPGCPSTPLATRAQHMDLKSKIRTIEHWPKPGIMFRDVTSLLQHPDAFRYTCDVFARRYADWSVDKVIGIDARGFIFSATLAYALGVGLIPARKPGKLPAQTIRRDYALEYGHATLELHADAIRPGERVVIIDDLIATGGTAAAAAWMVAELGGEVLECGFVVELPDLGGRTALDGIPVFSLVTFAGD